MQGERTWRNFAALIAAITAVGVVVILGFEVLGSPGTQRMVQSDLRTVRALAELAQQIHQQWSTSDRTLPVSLEKFPKSVKQDPLTAKPFGYHPELDNKYELCATFATDSRDRQSANPKDHWSHPKGNYCFEFDAAQPVPTAPYDSE